MAIFGSNQHSKNRVYLRRKSLRLQSWAGNLVVFICLAGASYFVYNRNEVNPEGVDELSTSTLSFHESIKYYHLKYFGGAEEVEEKETKK